MNTCTFWNIQSLPHCFNLSHTIIFWTFILYKTKNRRSQFHQDAAMFPLIHLSFMFPMNFYWHLSMNHFSKSMKNASNKFHCLISFLRLNWNQGLYCAGILSLSNIQTLYKGYVYSYNNDETLTCNFLLFLGKKTF